MERQLVTVNFTLDLKQLGLFASWILNETNMMKHNVNMKRRLWTTEQ